MTATENAYFLLLCCCLGASSYVLVAEPDRAIETRGMAEAPAGSREGAEHAQPDDPVVIAAIKQLGGNVFVDHHGRVTKVILHCCPATDADLKSLAGLKSLQTLNLRGASVKGPGITDAGLAHLSGLTSLRILELSVNSGITDEGLAFLRNLRRLEYLNISGTRVSNAGLVHLGQMSRLKRLFLPHRPRERNWGCTQEGLPVLWGLPIETLSGIYVNKDGYPLLRGLNHLRYFPNDFVDPLDTDLPHLNTFGQLGALSVSLSEGWKNTSRLHDLSGLRNLEALEIRGRAASLSEFDPVGLATLSSLPKLKSLRLWGITDAGMEHLPELPHVRKLDLSVSNVAGPGLAFLTRFPNLEALTLDRSTLTIEGLANLPQLPKLQILDLSGTPFRGDGLSHLYHGSNQMEPLGDKALHYLERMPALEELTVRGLSITDAGLAQLRHTPHLKLLAIDKTNITDAGLVHIRGLDRLQELKIWNTKISYEAAAAFHLAQPQCHITDNWCCGCMAFSSVATPSERKSEK